MGRGKEGGREIKGDREGDRVGGWGRETEKIERRAGFLLGLCISRLGNRVEIEGKDFFKPCLDKQASRLAECFQ